MKVTNEHLMERLESLDRTVKQNSKDIIDLYRIINTGIGGVKVFVWVGTIVIAILGWRMTE
jgi:hypothetical protein|tara:strand:- start:796 stop:978 length:183 start_codon:yes stop_codon:yes gene_type:complete